MFDHFFSYFNDKTTEVTGSHVERNIFEGNVFNI